MSTVAVAVYGTLKEGFSNYRLYLAEVKPRVARLVSLPYRMYDNGAYPMLVPAGGDEWNPIWVEIFDVDSETLRALDALEAPYGYWRESIETEELGERIEIYLHPSPAPQGFERVPSGNWTESRGS